jgi:hypothetical protein
MTTVETAGDLKQMQAQISLVGTVFVLVEIWIAICLI